MHTFTLSGDMAFSFVNDPAPKPRRGRPAKQKQKRNNITRAKTLTAQQLQRVLYDISQSSDYPERDTVMVLLGFEAGLRAVEISGLRWNKHIFDANGKIADALRITNDISKKSNERTVPLSKALRKALADLRAARPNDEFVVYPLLPRVDPETGRRKTWTEPNTIVQYMKRCYTRYGLNGVTSHSGRRSFITQLTRKAGSSPSFSLKDAQVIIGHRKLDTTAGYIELQENPSELISSLYD